MGGSIRGPIWRLEAPANRLGFGVSKTAEAKHYQQKEGNIAGVRLTVTISMASGIVWAGKRDDMLDDKMEPFNALMPVSIDESDIGEGANNRHNGPRWWHGLLAMDSMLGKHAQERRSWQECIVVAVVCAFV